MNIVIRDIPVVTRSANPPSPFDRYIVWKAKYGRLHESMKTLRIETPVKDLRPIGVIVNGKG